MSERRYVLKQAEITLKERTAPLKTSLMTVAEYTDCLKALKELRASGQHRDMRFLRLQNDVNDYRRRRRSPGYSHYYLVTIKLRHPRYRGHSEIFEIGMRGPSDNPIRNQLKSQIRSTISNFRARNREVCENHVKMGKHYVYMVTMRDGGRYSLREGQILALYVKKNMAGLFADKKPEVAKVKYLGIELEFCAKIREEQLALRIFRAGLEKFVQLKKDGSLRPKEGETGFELALLLPEKRYKKLLLEVLTILKSIGATASERRCGLHVHLDMRERNKDRAYNNLVSCQYVLMKLVDPQRRDNEFCQTVSSKKMPITFKGTRQERYKTINAASYYKYRTLEVRMHEGSVDYGHICGWIDLLIKIANYRKVLKENISKLTILKKRFNLNKKTYQYAVDRHCYWQLNSNGVNSVHFAVPAPRVSDTYEMPIIRTSQTGMSERQGA